jgi:hypothetical protein
LRGFGYRETLLAFDQHSRRILSRKSHLCAPARLGTFVAGFQQDFFLLTIVGLRVVVALRVVESDTVFILELCFPEVHIAIRSIVSTRLAIFSTSQPPGGAIRSFPRLLFPVEGVHGVGCASTATVLGASDVNDPVRGTEWSSRIQEGLPITPRRWGKDLRPTGATVLVFGPADIMAIQALDERASMIMSFECHACALA